MYENLTEKKIESKQVYDGNMLKVYCDKVELPNGETSTWDYIKHNGAVAIVPIFPDGTVLMERQFRYPFHRVVLEIPAGKIDPGETPLDACGRELREETGVVAKEIIPMGELYPSVAYTDEVIYLYIAKDFTFGENDLDDNEFLELERIPLETLVEMVMNNEIGDAKTQTAILKAYYIEKGVKF